MFVLCYDRGNVGGSVEHTKNLQHDRDDLVLVGYCDHSSRVRYVNYFVFARENGAAATTLKRLGWESEIRRYNGESFATFTGLDHEKWAIRDKLEAVFPDIIFEGWERIV